MGKWITFRLIQSCVFSAPWPNFMKNQLFEQKHLNCLIFNVVHFEEHIECENYEPDSIRFNIYVCSDFTEMHTGFPVDKFTSDFLFALHWRRCKANDCGQGDDLNRQLNYLEKKSVFVSQDGWAWALDKRKWLLNWQREGFQRVDDDLWSIYLKVFYWNV